MKKGHYGQPGFTDLENSWSHSLCIEGLYIFKICPSNEAPLHGTLDIYTRFTEYLNTYYG